MLLAVMGVRPRLRMKLHPDGEFFFLQHVERHQDAANHVAQNLRPLLLDERQLAFERIGRSQRRGAQHIDEVLVFAARTRGRVSK